MHNYEFAVWLDGYRSIVGAGTLDRKQAFIIRNHLNLVKAVTGGLGDCNDILFNLVTLYREDARDAHSTAVLFKIAPMIGRLQNETELAYWLQGAIEIGRLKELTGAQCDVVAKKIGVMAERKELASFVVEKVDCILGFPADAGDHFRSIADHLNSRFRHDIDPTYAGDQELFGAIHRGAAEA